MTMTEIKNVAVVGAGAMGSQIGMLCALAGYSATISDISRDALDRALVDLAAFYRDVLLVQSGSPGQRAHPDFDGDVRTVARAVPPTGTLHRLEAILACREALELNVKPRIAVEAMTVTLRLP